MAGLPKSVRDITDPLDAVGNTTKALTKGFAIATAVIAALSLFSAFVNEVSEQQMKYNSVLGHLPIEILKNTGIRIDSTHIFVGFLIGGAVPFLFSSFAIRAVGRSAFQIVEEVRRQFRLHPGILEGTEKPEYATCVDIVTAAAQKELVAPAILGICTPVAIAFILGPDSLGGYLAGAILSGQLLAVFMSTSGGAWDNAKKKIEDGMLGGKGTECHKASVIGDTVGDPFKDTAGPALNPLIKVMNLVSILVAPFAVGEINPVLRFGVSGLMILLIGAAYVMNKREGVKDTVDAEAMVVPVA